MSEKSAKFLDDITKITANTAGLLAESSKAVQEKLKSHVQAALSEMDVISREEFEVVKESAKKAREENEELKKRIEKLEKGNKTTASKKDTKTKDKSPAKKKK